MHKILFFGDSLTAGYGLADPSTESFPGLIQKKLDAAGYPYRTINAGVSGDTSSGGLARLARWLTQPIDVFVLELGVNDFFRGLPASATYNNLDKILERVRKKYPHCKIAIMGLEVPDFLSNPKIEEYKSIFRRLADKYDTALVPFFLQGVAGVSQLNLHDGIHPNSKGYAVVADHVWPTIEALLIRTAKTA